ncbi:MAG TPA: aminoglycoside phosphotransferase family protein, partial [Methylomirabilota bacterium]|nr:aminoglycoside phosphotransferase family protein [Methylomirabilota bacterium]
ASWMRPGWRARALRWAERRVGARAIRIIQLRTWEGSAVLRLTTRRGAYVLKAVEPPCDHEPRFTRWLARRFPARIAPVVAVGAGGRWLLMRAVQGRPLAESRRLADWMRAAREYGRLQRALVGDAALSRALGHRRRDLVWLGRVLPRLLADSRALAVGARARLRPREIARLRALGPDLRARWRALSRLGVPLALDHGDFWASNVLLGRRGPVFLDWEDAVLSHPFWGAFMLPWSHGFWDRWGHRGAAAARVRAAYLEGWAGAKGTPRDEPAFALARRLAPLHHAAIWWRDVVPHLTTSLETAELMPFFLRRALEEGRG